MTNESETTLLEFPCRFPIKAMGRQSDDFETLVSEIVTRDGRKVRGWSRKVTQDALQIYTPEKQLWTTYFIKDLQSNLSSPKSLMPRDLYESLTEKERRSLYCARQVKNPPQPLVTFGEMWFWKLKIQNPLVFRRFICFSIK